MEPHGRHTAAIVLLLFAAAMLCACGDGSQAVRVTTSTPPTSITEAVKTGDVEEVKHRLVEDGRVKPDSKPVGEALALAVEEGRTEVVKLLLEAGADANAKQENGRSLLVKSMRVSPAVALLLLEHGADVGARDQLGQTPLHYAVTAKRLDVAKELIKRHADVNAADRHGLTALHMALGGEVAMLDLLAESGADLNATDVRGSTAMHKAAAAGNVPAIEWLIERGVKINVKNTAGFTPMDIARPEAAAILKKYASQT